MKKFINHVDHVTWISRLENIEANVANLETITDGHLVRFERADMGFVMYLDWDSGLEVVAPFDERTEFNQALHDRLQTHGEGILGIVFGVDNLEKHKEKLEAKGLQIGPLMDDLPSSPWHDRLVLRERAAPAVMNSWMILGQIDYQDDVVKFVDVTQGTEADG
jgi:hypothetical protein